MDKKEILILNSLWLSELCEKFKDKIVINEEVSLEGQIPQISVSELYRLCESSNTDMWIKCGNGDNEEVLACYMSDEARSYDRREIQAFSEVGYIPKEVEPEFSLHLHRCLDLSEQGYIEHEKRSIISLDKRFGKIDLSSKVNLLIGVPIHNRKNLTKIFVRYVNNYLLPSLKWEGLNVCCIFCGSADDFENLSGEFSPDKNFFLERENLLGLKKNEILNVAKKVEAEALIWIDSDDFFHPETVMELVNTAQSNGFWSAIKNFSFYDAKSELYGVFEGYSKGHDLHLSGMGSGRVFTEDLIATLDNPFPHQNKSIDMGIRKILDQLKIDPDLRLIESYTQLPIGVKTNENIWGMGNYRTIDVSVSDHAVSWLPKEISKSVNELKL